MQLSDGIASWRPGGDVLWRYVDLLRLLIDPGSPRPSTRIT
jgi:hypothetical protein